MLKTFPPSGLMVVAGLLLAAGLALGAIAIFQMGRSMTTSQTENQTNNEQELATQQNASNPPMSKNQKEKTDYWSQIKQHVKDGWKDFVEVMERNDKAVVAISTMVIALFTVFLVVATAMLFISSERVAHSAKESAEVAQSALKLSEDTAERQLRAYISLLGSTLVVTPDQKSVQAQVTIKNFGHTPAYRVSHWLFIRILDANLPHPFAEEATAEERAHKSIMGPTADFWLFNTAPVTPQVLAEIQRGDKIVYVWGGVDYVDAFGKKRFYILRQTNGPLQQLKDARPGGAQVGFVLMPHSLGFDAN